MGKLSKVRLKRTDVPIDGSEDTVTVKGLSVPDIDALIERHEKLFNEAFRKYSDKFVNQLPDAVQIIEILRKDLAELIPDIICLGNEEPLTDENIAFASNLPAVSQLDCLVEIVGLTVSNVETLKKILWAVINGCQSLDSLKEVDMVQSTTSDGASGKKSRSASRKAK